MRSQPQGIFEQFVPPLRRSRNAFQEDDDDDIEELTSLGSSARTRRRFNYSEDIGEHSVDVTTGLRYMTPAQSRLAKLFQPPFDIISNYDLEMVCASLQGRRLLTNTGQRFWTNTEEMGHGELARYSRIPVPNSKPRPLV